MLSVSTAIPCVRRSTKCVPVAGVSSGGSDPCIQICGPHVNKSGKLLFVLIFQKVCCGCVMFSLKFGFGIYHTRTDYNKEKLQKSSFF